ncbi:energy transducer TonB [Salinibacter altiplanensis]|uniref:energy transducer TonB n=1 Tax=Salinibacter altiplanensis TaxID=1803181 RepID=UPI001E331C9A|nr:energy transducer TonB [Salinibacter altiplanensis]
MRRSTFSTSDQAYRRRLLGALAVVLALGVALVRWWPAPAPQAPEGPFGKRGPDRIQINEVQPTAQSREQTPPPPAPVPPNVVPNNVVIEEELEFGTSALAVDAPEDDDQLREGTTDTPRAARTPDTNARLFRAVQPNYPAAAREESIQARIRVAVQVSEAGRVTEATVLKRWRLAEEGRVHAVAQLDHGLEAAALVAAQRSRFRPAQQNGQPVSSQTTLTFEFGTPE